MHRQSSRVPQSLQPPPPPQPLPTTPHPASSRSLSSSTSRTGVFPPSLPPSQTTEEPPSCCRREPRFIEARKALTKSMNNGDKRCGGAEHNGIMDTPFRIAWGREENIPGVGKPEPKEFVTKGVPCHVGDRGHREGFQGGNEGCDGEEESCEELSLDLSNCSEQVRSHP